MPHRQHRNANAAPPQPRRKRRSRRRSEWMSGTLVELDVERRRVKVRVDEAPGMPFTADSEVTVDAGSAVLKVTDGDGDGLPGISDLFPGDELKVYVVRSEDGGPPTATRIEQRSPGAPPGGLRRLYRQVRGREAAG